MESPTLSCIPQDSWKAGLDERRKILLKEEKIEEMNGFSILSCCI